MTRTALHRGFTTALLTVAAGMAGCQGNAGVKMAFDNRSASGLTAQALTLAEGQTPTVFGIKMTAVYLVEDVAPDMDNVGEVGRIWINPVCDEGLHQCGIGRDKANRVTDFFDLALPTDEVNRNLNAQSHDIKPGTYRYLRVDFTGPLPPNVPNDPTLTNLRFGAGDMVSEVRNNQNGVTVKIEPPLELADGDSATVALGYDYRGSYFPSKELDSSHPPDGDFQNWLCSDLSADPVRGPCLHFSGFTPRVVGVVKGMPAAK
jgi:hypothetical protein